VEQWGEKEGMKTALLKKNSSIQDLVGNEENGYSAPNSNKTTVNVTNEPIVAHKNTLKEEILQESLKNLWRRYSTWLTQMYNMNTRSFKTPKIKKMRIHRNK
jgi:hypothetical protein